VAGEPARRLSGTSDDVVLIVDDYHLIERPASHEAVAALLAHGPEGLHVVIGSRIDPPFPLVRLRAPGSSPSSAPPMSG
jgi:LuxR family maltose regulon positive regulatory protein